MPLKKSHQQYIYYFILWMPWHRLSGHHRERQMRSPCRPDWLIPFEQGRYGLPLGLSWPNTCWYTYFPIFLHFCVLTSLTLFLCSHRHHKAVNQWSAELVYQIDDDVVDSCSNLHSHQNTTINSHFTGFVGSLSSFYFWANHWCRSTKGKISINLGIILCT